MRSGGTRSLLYIARRDLFAYIEAYYNRQQLHSTLGYITPDEAKRQVA
jgi:putative transposase